VRRKHFYAIEFASNNPHVATGAAACVRAYDTFARGWQRAGSWSALLGAGLGGSDFPRPALIYAANPEGPAGDEPSQRPFETIVPPGGTPGTNAVGGCELAAK
jgi:hypothetical protein